MRQESSIKKAKLCMKVKKKKHGLTLTKLVLLVGNPTYLL